MGGGSSKTRKLTVSNDDPTSVIKVSNDVTERIMQSASRRNKDPQEQRSDANQQQQPQPIDPAIMQPPAPYLYEPRFTNIQLRQNQLAELKKNDNYWKNRMKHLQDNQSKIDSVIEQECQKAMDELAQHDKKIGKLPPCDVSKEQLFNCYKENTKEPMKCAPLVEQFQRCVDRQRQAIVTQRG